MSETSWGRGKYRTTSWKAYNAALKARGDLTIWLNREMQWLAPPTGKRGRCQKFSDAAIQLCRRQKSLEVQVCYRASDKGLHMLADSTGIKFLGEGEWKTKKHGAERRRQWRKVHLGIDAQTLQIRAIAVTTNEVGDLPMAAALLG